MTEVKLQAKRARAALPCYGQMFANASACTIKYLYYIAIWHLLMSMSNAMLLQKCINKALCN